MSTTPLFASEQSAATSRCPVQDEATRTNATALRKGSTHHKLFDRAWISGGLTHHYRVSYQRPSEHFCEIHTIAKRFPAFHRNPTGPRKGPNNQP